MNVKFSQLPYRLTLKNTDLFPMLSDGDNYIAPASTIYEYLSGDKLIRVYSSYASNSAYLLQSANLANSVYTTYNNNSSFYILVTNPLVANWNSVYSSVNSTSSYWVNASNYTQGLSSQVVVSNTDPTLFPNASAVKNIIAITQANYDALTYIDPETFYVIAS